MWGKVAVMDGKGNKKRSWAEPAKRDSGDPPIADHATIIANLDATTARSAVILSEIIGPPVSKRQNAPHASRFAKR